MELRKLIEKEVSLNQTLSSQSSKDQFAIEHLSYIISLFAANLEDEDSYMYLTAINGLVTVGYKFPQRTFGLLAQELL